MSLAPRRPKRPRDGLRRGLVALLGLLALAGLVALPQLEVRLEPRALLPDAPELDATEAELAERFGRPTGPPLLVRVHADDVTSPEALAAIDRLTRALERSASVDEVEGPTRVPLPIPRPMAEGPVGSDPSEELDEELDEALDEALDDAQLDALLTLIEANPEIFPAGLASIRASTDGPLRLAEPLSLGAEAGAAVIREHRQMLGPLISVDGASALLVVHLREGEQWTPELLAEPLAQAAALHPELTGGPVLEETLRGALSHDAPLLVGLAMLGNALVLLLAIRTRRGVALPLGAAGISLSLLFLAMVLAQQPFTLLHAMLPPLILTVAIADAIHILFRHQDNLAAAGVPPGEAPDADAGPRVVQTTVREMVAACLVTSLTTAAGFGALLLADTPAVRDLALWVAVGIAFAYLATLTFVSSGLPGVHRSPRARGHHSARLASASARWALPVVGLWLALGATGVALGSTIEQGNRLLAPFPDDLAPVEVLRAIDREHGGARRLVLLAPDPETSRELGDWLATRAEVSGVTSADLLRYRVFETLGPPGSPPPTDAASRRALGVLAGPLLEGWEAPDGTQRLEVRLRDVPAETMVELVRELDQRGATAVAGEAARTSLGVSTIQADLAQTFGLALLTIFGFMALLLRSVPLALVALLPNLVPLAIGLGWMALRGIALDASTAMVFAASLGLAVDGTVHALVRYRAHGELDWPARVERSFREAGPGILVGGATLLAGFAALFASELPPVLHFAELATVTLAVATLAELTLLPALLRFFVGADRRDTLPPSPPG